MATPIMPENDYYASIVYIAAKLNNIIELSYKDNSITKQLIDEVGKIYVPSEFLYLKDAVLTHLFWVNGVTPGKPEKIVRDNFYNNLDKYLPGAKVFKMKSDGKNIPDGFVQINNEVYAVEVKRDKFDWSALVQLKRYMKTYNCPGIAVAKKLCCNIPKSVTFVGVKP